MPVGFCYLGAPLAAQNTFAFVERFTLDSLRELDIKKAHPFGVSLFCMARPEGFEPSTTRFVIATSQINNI